jgi:hypothetical protein
MRAIPASPDEAVIGHADARAITGLTLPGLTRLLTAGVLTTSTHNRRQYVTVAGIERWARRIGRQDVLQRLARHRAAYLGGSPGRLIAVAEHLGRPRLMHPAARGRGVVRPGLYRRMWEVDRPAEDEHHRRAEVTPSSGPSVPLTVV